MLTRISSALYVLLYSYLIALQLAGGATKNINLQQLTLIKNSIDTAYDPCENFHSYACGRWELSHHLQEYQETIGLLDEKTNFNFARILKKLRQADRGSQHQFVQNVLNHYHSCFSVNEDYNPRLYLQLLQKTEHIQWPTLRRRGNGRTSGADDNYDWIKMLAILRRYGLNGIFLEETVIQHKDNASELVLDLDKPVLDGGFQPFIHLEYELVLMYLGVETKRNALQLWEWTRNFEQELLNLTEIEEEEGYQELTLEELEMPQLRKYLKVLFDDHLPGNTKLNVQNLPYLRKMFATIDLYEPEVICRYLMIRFMHHLLSTAPDNFIRLDCIQHLRSMLPLAMTWLHREHYPMLNKDRENVVQIFERLKEHFMLTLSQNHYRLNSTLLETLKSKLQQMQLRIGDLPSSTEVITEFYKDLKLHSSPAAFYQNHLSLLRHHTLAQHARLGGFPSSGENFFHLEDAETGASSSPFYLLRSNIVVVPLGLLQPPIFHRNMHDIFKYSSLGFLLAHEITHGFDESGLDFDSFGKMQGPVDILKSNSHFNHSLGCLRGQLPSSIDEKIADVSGLRLAYDAYFSVNSISMYSNLEWSSIPTEQLFFLNFAQFFCGRSERLQDISEHGADSERIKRALANFPEFSRVYQCPLGSTMNPMRKCHLWR